MDDRVPTEITSGKQWLSDLWRLSFIVLMTLMTRGWVLLHTEVLSRDSIGFIRFALQLEDPPNDSLKPAEKLSHSALLRNTYQPPGYSLALLAVSWPVRSAMGGTTCDSMVVSAQLTSILASIFLIFPMYYLGKSLFNRQTAFIATLLFQTLPVSTLVSSDGLSDSLFLFMSAMALWTATMGMQRHSPLLYLGAGAFSGLAYLVRPEGLILVTAFGITLLICRFRNEIGWKSVLSRGCLLGLGLLVVMSPYVMTIGKLTNKPTGEGLLRWFGGGELKPSWMESSRKMAPAEAPSFPLAVWWHETKGSDESRLKWAIKALLSETLKGSFYILPLFAAIGFYASRHRFRSDTPLTQILVLSMCHFILLWFIASKAGYVAERHTLMIVLSECYFVAASFPILGELLASQKCLSRFGGESTWAALIAAVFIAATVPAGMKTLHANRSGHHAAGLWLASHRQPDDFVLDPFSWAEFYGGDLREPARISPGTTQVYAIVESLTANPHPRLHLMRTALAIAHQGELVFKWPADKPVDEAKVLIYRCDLLTFGTIWAQYAAIRSELESAESK